MLVQQLVAVIKKKKKVFLNACRGDAIAKRAKGETAGGESDERVEPRTSG